MSREFPVSRTLRRHPLAFALAASLTFAPAQGAIAHPSGGATLIVHNCSDSGPGSLRDAIAAAVSGDHIVIAPTDACTQITLTGGPLLVANGADAQPLAQLDIRGAGYYAMTIDGGGANRVIVQSAGADALLSLTGMHITNGRDDSKGGCIAADGIVTLTNVGVSDCVAGVITGDTVFGNTPVRGGGIYAAGAARVYGSTVQRCKVYGGSAYAYGGGVFARGDIEAVGATIVHNEAHSEGGAAYGGGLAAGDRAAELQATVDLYASSVQDNTVESCAVFAARAAAASGSMEARSSPPATSRETSPRARTATAPAAGSISVRASTRSPCSLP